MYSNEQQFSISCLGGYITTNALVRNTKVVQLSYILKQKSGRKNVLSAGIANWSRTVFEFVTL